MASTTDDARPTARTRRWRKGHVPRHVAGADRHDEDDAEGSHGRPLLDTRRRLPRGNDLDEASFERRHLFLCLVLALHVPALFALGAWRGHRLGHVALELSFPLACVALGRLVVDRRPASFIVTTGLVSCSIVLVHLSGGTTEAHFHFFVLIGLVALYQDWAPFAWYVALALLAEVVGSAIAGDIMFGHGPDQNRPWVWGAIHGGALLAACVGQIIVWRATEQEQKRSVELASELAAADVARREAMSELLVNLARRNQSLLNRQLEVITDLELRESQPDVLEQLLRLDHLATRVRRNAESLLVLSGDEPARRWGGPVPLGDVVRTAAAEIEDDRRVEVLVNDHLHVDGRAVADLAHLLAELIENAATFSPPTTAVRVRSHLSAGDPPSPVVSIEDNGIGMAEEDLRRANALLAEAPEAELGWSTMLGFQVVARLARRHGLVVRLAPTPGGGVTAMVTLADDVVSERPIGAVEAPGPLVGPDRDRRAAARVRARADGGDGAARRWLPAPAQVAHRWPVRPAAPPWRELPAASRSLPPAPATPVERRPEPPEPADWWWESETLVRARRPDGADAPDPAGQSGPAVAGTPAAEATPAPSATGASATPAGPDVDAGLVRRVPGAHLPPSARREADTPSTDQTPAPDSARKPRLDREQVRSMLSRFQDRQRAGRAAADDTSLDDSSQEDR